MTVMISSEFKVIFYILIFVLVPVGYSVQNQSLKKKNKTNKNALMETCQKKAI